MSNIFTATRTMISDYLQNPEEAPVPQDRTGWPVYRTRTLPEGALRGTFIIVAPLIPETREALVNFALAGLWDGGHEGMVFWAGREMPGCTVLLQVIVPDADSSAQRVMTSKEEVGRVQRIARKHNLGVLAQVHSHPGKDARHSDGDDHLILLPFENMLSIVTPSFGVGFMGLNRSCVHQFQDGQWVLCTPESVQENIFVVPTSQDLR